MSSEMQNMKKKKKEKRKEKKGGCRFGSMSRQGKARLAVTMMDGWMDGRLDEHAAAGGCDAE